MVGAGIFLSRIVGLVRERVIATCFGTTLYADVFGAALRLPNVLQNLLGEGTLSASFIPVYSELLGRGRHHDAGKLAGAVFALLLAIAGAIALLGMALAPALVSLLTPGFEGQRRSLMITTLRILFPMTGVLVLSAWALGILNSHRKFFVPYFAPVLWNVAIIVALLTFNSRVALDELLIAAAWGALAGGLFQFAFQLPWVFKLEKHISLKRGPGDGSFREVVRNAVPAILGRGVVQLSAYVDLVLASLLAIGAVARLRYAQTLYLLPVSLFAMSVAAAALPELARERAGAVDALRARALAALARVSFYVVPSFVAFLLLGDVLVAGVYQSGKFGASDVTLVWITLIAYSAGLLASTHARIYQSAFFALRDTRTTARIATLRVVTSGLAGAALMLQFEPIELFGRGIPAGVFEHWRVGGLPLGPVGLAAGAALGAWLEWALLRRALARRIGAVGAGAGAVFRMFIAALLAAAAGYGLSLACAQLHALITASVVVGGFGVVYFIAARVLGLEEARVLTGTLVRRLRR
jgi:putative peptidoglycan lipid II flippase